MNRKTLAIASLLVVATMAGVAAVVANMTPPDLSLPTHWGISGEPDRFSGKWTALLMPPAMVAGVSLLFYFLPSLEPRREGLARSQSLYLWGWLSLLLMGGVIQLAVVSLALRWGLHANSLIVGGLGVMLAMIGNQLGKSRSMYLIGFRTPWTLASEEVWIKTHRLAGKLMVGGGLLMLIAAALPIPSGLLASVLFAVMGIAVTVPLIYSFLLWRRERRAQPSE
ncbi:MAG TPA: SdpI family protein [Allosphingosinicella sp.]|nr:SdpI family protein [Allosphingosinicella sp.]